MKKTLLVTAALLAAVAVLVAFTLPPAHLTLERSFDDGAVPGVIHVHTNRSDGRGTVDEVAAAVARAGLKFVVLTDHGDATREPDPPSYRSGVLCIDAVEISTTGGHYLALDMPASPYPLGGEPRDVVEDVKRLGGFGVAAHPNSPKPSLAWRDWDAPFDGIEWMNPDTSWRMKTREPGWRGRWYIVTALAGYLFRAPETIAHVMAGTALEVSRWQALASKRRIVLLAGADAHARLPLRNEDPGPNDLSLTFPSYDTSFRTLSVHVRPDRPLTNDAARDATTVMQAIRRGHVYSAIDAAATPPAFQFSATNAAGTAGEGDALGSNGPVTLRVHSNAPSSFVTILWRDGEAFFRVQDQVEITREVPSVDGVYWTTIDAPPERGSVPWIVSNPIYVGQAPSSGGNGSQARSPIFTVKDSRPLFDGRTTTRWRTEVDRTSLAAVDVVTTATSGELRFRYGLSGGASVGQFASLGVELADGAAPYNRLTFTARGEKPMRITVQFQPLGRSQGWQRSVYLDDTNREYSIPFEEAASIGETATAHPDAAMIHDVLFVVETSHTKPGASGFVWVKKVALER